jgi:hypothetical protein
VTVVVAVVAVVMVMAKAMAAAVYGLLVDNIMVWIEF